MSGMNRKSQGSRRKDACHPEGKKLSVNETPLSLVIVNLNSTGVMNKIAALEAFVDEHKPDIVTMTET